MNSDSPPFPGWLRPVIFWAAALSPLVFMALAFAGHFWWGLGLMALTHAALIYPTLSPACQWLGPVYTAFHTNEKQVWLTIDDGPEPAETPEVLDLLDRWNAKATFFEIGAKAEAYPDLIREIISRGHQVSNHTQTHPERTFWMLSPKRIAAEIENGHATLTSILGQSPAFFRSPVGMKNPFVHPVLRRLNVPLIGWTARGLDGVDRNADRIVERLIPGIRPGAILLLHEGRGTLRETLPRVLDYLAQNGYCCVLPTKASLVTGLRNRMR